MRNGRILLPVAVTLFAALTTAAVAWVLVTMVGHKQDAKRAFVRVAEINEVSTDPRAWGLNWPHQFDQYKLTAGDKFYGGSSALPESKLDQSPWLRRLFAGYAFSIDYREARGHAYMLYDQVVTERVHQRPQAGACLHCHASSTVLYRKVGLESLGKPADQEALAASFNMAAVTRGFEILSTKPYHDVLEMLTLVPDGTTDDGKDNVFESPPVGGFNGTTSPNGHFNMSQAHPMSCIDCHDPATMALRITRPGFMRGIAALANSPQPLPHLPSIEQWRRGDRKSPYDPNILATRHEMRSFACAQCHVEYYCATKDILEFPWGQGLKAEQIEKHWEDKTFPDGSPFADYVHTETGTSLFKVQHPEFELWSQGTHARAGVSCADCHMPYERMGAMKVSNHNVRSPMENINHACQNCHHVSENELVERVETIQLRTKGLTERAAVAMTDMLDAVVECRNAGATDEQLAEIRLFQRKSMWLLDFISSENSHGFHAPQESARLLGESIDNSRQAHLAALKLTQALLSASHDSENAESKD
jgi:nitrite reductase (cytochrome c-552)